MVEPLIWTSKGNVPVSHLQYEKEWRVNTDQIVFIERYYQGEEIVKESSHVYLLIGASAEGAAAM